MAITGLGNYGNIYGSMYAAQLKETVSEKNDTSKASETKEENIQEYQKRLQSKVKDVTLETGTSLNMKKDNKIGTVTIHPELLKKMQNNPEAEKKYTQLIKDIERAEQTVGAYYNAIGGVVERCSHWYIDENGKYCHFGYVRRDDKLNKKLREERQKNSEKLMEKTKEKAAEKKEALEEMLKEKAKKEKEIGEKAEETSAYKKVEQLMDEKMAASKDGAIYLNDTDVQTIMEAVREDDTGRTDTKEQTPAGANLDLQV